MDLEATESRIDLYHPARPLHPKGYRSIAGMLRDIARISSPYPTESHRILFLNFR